MDPSSDKKDNSTPNQASGAPSSPPPAMPDKQKQSTVSEEMESVVKLESEPDTNPANTKENAEKETPPPEPAQSTVIEPTPEETPETPETPTPPEEAPADPATPATTPEDEPKPAEKTDAPQIPNADDSYDPSLVAVQFFKKSQKQPINRKKLIIIIGSSAAVFAIIGIILYFTMFSAINSPTDSITPTDSSNPAVTQQPEIDDAAADTAIDEAIGTFIDAATSEQQVTNTDDTSELEAAGDDVTTVGESIDEENL